jgi:hypothetical protein
VSVRIAVLALAIVSATAAAQSNPALGPCPRTPTILQSSSIALSHAVCDAIVKVAFSPAVLHGERVRAMYQERFIFRTGATNADIDQAMNHGGDRH